MRHNVRGRKFGRYTATRNALLKSLAINLIKHEQITTTLPKAKDLRPEVEKLITMGKQGGLNRLRLAVGRIGDQDVVKKLFGELAERYKTRQGGYVRIMKTGHRYGDAAPMAVIELVDRNPEAKGREDRERVAAQEAAAREVA